MSRQDLETSDKAVCCPECEGKNIIEDSSRGEDICASCGLVLSEHKISTDAEWRSFSKEESDKRARTGGPMTAVSRSNSMTTLICWNDRDASGERLKGNRRVQISRLRQTQVRNHLQNPTEQNFSRAETEIGRICSQLGLSKQIKNAAFMMYQHVTKKKLIVNKCIKTTVAAVLSIICRQYEVGRSLDDIDEHTLAKKKDIARVYRAILNKSGRRLPTPKSSIYIDRYASSLKIEPNARRIAIQIIKESKDISKDVTKKDLITGKDPRGIAASAIYIACMINHMINGGHKVTQREISEVSSVTEVTVRNNYKTYNKALGLKLELAQEGNKETIDNLKSRYSSKTSAYTDKKSPPVGKIELYDSGM